MRYYKIGSRLEAVEKRPARNAVRIELYTAAEWYASDDAAQLSLLQPFNKQRFTKLDTYAEYVAGTLTVPDRDGKRYNRSAYYVLRDRLILIDDSEFLAGRLEHLAQTRQWKSPSPGAALYSLLNDLIDDDMEYLERFEDKLGAIEEAVLAHHFDDFNRLMPEIRGLLQRRARFYSQLQNVAQELEEDENDLFDDALERLFHLLGDRAGRRESFCQGLREYSVQIREVYQSHIDLMQNNTMKVLTVVATIFMPLTLIVGWYGMNFAHMPELSWEYGYPVVVALCLLVAGVSVWWFKKKNML